MRQRIVKTSLFSTHSLELQATETWKLEKSLTHFVYRAEMENR